MARAICKASDHGCPWGWANTAQFYRYTDAALAAIKDAGYAVVPVDPTEAMVLVTQHSSVGKSPVLSERMTKEVYKAMLEAAKETGE
jgi:hypothetical protein